MACSNALKAFLAIAVLGASASTSTAQTTPAPDPGTPPTITESFEGAETALMLGGQIDFQTDKGPWVLYVKDERLVMENRKSPQSLHYNDITWVNFPGSALLESTEHMLITVTVDSETNGTGGAGFIVGSGKRGMYLMFSVDEQGRFHVLQKDGRRLRPVHSASHPALVIGGPNTLSFDVKGAHVTFVANGTDIIQIPYPNRMSVTREQNGQAGIGLSAFGTGTFYFDDVVIARPD